MTIISKPRGCGKTHQLIMLSDAMQIPIAVETTHEVHNIIEKAKKLKCNIPDPVTITHLKTCKRGGSTCKKVLLDNMECVFRDIMRNLDKEEVVFTLYALLRNYLNADVAFATTSAGKENDQ